MTTPTGSSPEAESRLTFGVELEFLLATVPKGGENPHPSDPREVDPRILEDQDSINYDIERKLEEVSIPATVKESDYGNSKEVTAAIATDWILKTDITVGPGAQSPSTRDYYHYGLEMSSPPYYYDAATRKAVETVVRALRNNYLLRVNESTGLHVHIGNGYHGFEWPILRNFMAIAWTYERQILLMVPEARIDNEYCKSIYEESPLGKNNPGLTRLEFLNRILSLTDNVQVVEELGHRCIGFNIRNLKPPFRSDFGQRTIEFRHHPGTLDSESILHWVHICVKLVEKACLIKSEKELFEQLRTDVEKPIGFGDENNVTTVDYLMWLGCPSQAYYYGKQLISDKVRVEKRKRDAAEKTSKVLPTKPAGLPQDILDTLQDALRAPRNR
ncbi:uncharacterized protein EAF01_009968 [Botrytis porri]|uniref:Amidoligase enzyme n=1 Tax=Botrytis porri TaxID=87229 RepID=A0A4Z1KS26_9HELO|nr:uncharacterized protein EAF01_009968 [Botrytis porri]KAF7894517.1 hypothetical protein EAF01_009968 [Botrytis porri]TGO85215.1 hypothetical protein BPOR_0419g00060 [Botrytis porri]